MAYHPLILDTKSRSRFATVAERLFKEQPYLRNKLARAMFLRSKIIGHHDVFEAAGVLSKAVEILSQSCPDYNNENLQEAFDLVIPFRSR